MGTNWGIGCTRVVTGVVLTVLWGCGGTVVPHKDSTPTPTSTPVSTATDTPVPTATDTPVPTATDTPAPTATLAPTPTLGPGANVVFMGVLRADDSLLEPSGFDDAGRPIYERPAGSGFVLVVEARPGTNGAQVGRSAFNSDSTDPSVRPDLQIEVSRDLGDGSPAVCDNTTGNFGGVPGIDPPSFADTQAVSGALNDLGCRFNDGTGQAQGRLRADACVLFPDGDFHFVSSTTTVQFCGFVIRPMSFPDGDTIVTARVRDVGGVVGPERQIVVRITGF